MEGTKRELEELDSGVLEQGMIPNISLRKYNNKTRHENVLDSIQQFQFQIDGDKSLAF